MPHTVIAQYRPKPGFESALLALVDRHVPRLRELELATEAPVVLLRAADGTLLEIFDWRDEAAVETAHVHPEVQSLWEEFGTLCDFTTLASLQEAGRPFPHFERLPSCDSR